jgi:hypothetical protein
VCSPSSRSTWRAPLQRRALNPDALCLSRPNSDPSRIRPANDREASRNDENGWSNKCAGHEDDSRIAPGRWRGPGNTLKVETRVQIPLGLQGQSRRSGH